MSVDVTAGRGQLDLLTYDAAQGELPAPHSLHQPHSQQGEQEVGEGGESGQPDGQPVVPHSRHLQDGGAVVPVGHRGGRKKQSVPVAKSSIHMPGERSTSQTQKLGPLKDNRHVMEFADRHDVLDLLVQLAAKKCSSHVSKFLTLKL